MNSTVGEALMHDHVCPKCQRPFGSESANVNFCPYGCGSISDQSGYVTAFYELAGMMDIGARPRSPEQVWEREMKPRLVEALSGQQSKPEHSWLDRIRASMPEEAGAIGRLTELVEYLDAIGDTCFVVGGRRIYTDDLRTIIEALSRRAAGDDVGPHPLIQNILEAHGAPEARILPEAPHWNGVGKYGHALGLGHCTLNIMSRGFGAKDGGGELVVMEGELDWDRDEDGKEYVSVPVSNSDLLFLRDQLNKLFPAALTSTSTVAVGIDAPAGRVQP